MLAQRRSRDMGLIVAGVIVTLGSVVCLLTSLVGTSEARRWQSTASLKALNDLQRLDEGSDVVATGSIAPDVPVAEEGLALYERWEHEIEYEDGDRQSRWRHNYTYDHKPTFDLLLGNERLSVQSGFVVFYNPREITIGEHVRLKGFAPEDLITIMGKVVSPDAPCTVRAEYICGGQRENCIRRFSRSSVGSAIGAGLFFLVGGSLVWLGLRRSVEAIRAGLSLLLLPFVASCVPGSPTPEIAYTPSLPRTTSPSPLPTLEPSPTLTGAFISTSTATPSSPPPTPMSTSRSTSSPTSTPAATTTPQPTPISLPEAIRQVTPIEDVLPGRFQRLHASPDGTLWLITDDGVAVRRDEDWRTFLDDLSGELVGIDPDGRVWVMSEDTAQIRAWDGSSWTVYGAEAGWQPLVVEGEWYREIGWVQPDEQGRLWLATSQDVRVLRGERWTVFTPVDMGMEPFDPHVLWATFALEVAESTDTVWVGECDWGGPGPVGGHGVRWFNGKAWHGADAPVSGGCATFIKEDGQGRVWMGVEENVWRYDAMSGGWTQFAPPDPPIADMRFGFVHALAMDPHDDAWPALVLCGGASCFGSIALYRIQDGVWTQIGDTVDFGGGLPAHKLVPDGAGAYWLFWVGSIYRVVGETATRVPGVGPVYHAVADASGHVWFAAWYEGRDWLWTLDVRA